MMYQSLKETGFKKYMENKNFVFCRPQHLAVKLVGGCNKRKNERDYSRNERSFFAQQGNFHFIIAKSLYAEEYWGISLSA